MACASAARPAASTCTTTCGYLLAVRCPSRSCRPLGVATPVAVITALTASVPVLVAILTFLPRCPPPSAMVVFDGGGLRVFCRACYLLPRLWDYLRLILGAVGYRIQFAVAASRGVWREAQGQRGWGRIAHPGCNAPNSGANLD